MYYYPEEEVLFFQGDNLAVYVDPDKLEIITLDGKLKFEINPDLTQISTPPGNLPVAFKFLNEGLSIVLDRSSIISNVSREDCKLLTNWHSSIKVITLKSNAFALLTVVLNKWCPNLTNRIENEPGFLTEIDQKHYTLILKTYELRAHQGYI